MSSPFIQFAFAAGVVTPSLWHRPDLEKYGLALAKGHNWLIEIQGGAMVRPALEFIDYLRDGDQTVRLCPFQFNSNTADTYMLVFSHQRVSFIQNGAYVLETPVSITSVSNTNPAVVTASSHGFSNGDWIKIVSTAASYEELTYLTFEVSNVTTHTFEIKTPDGAAYDTSGMGAFSGAATAARIYSVTTPYDEADLRSLDFDHYRDILYITGNSYAPRKLIRSGATSWALSLVDFEGNEDAPSAPTLTPSTTGNAGAIYGVTAIDSDGVESYLKKIGFLENSVDITDTAGKVEIKWTAIPGAISYNIFRGIFHMKDEDATAGEELGYIGSTLAPHFSDENVIPDFTKSPPTPDNPFANGAVLVVDVTTQGSGYTKAGAGVSISGGTGFEGLPIVDDGGKVIGVRILKPGSGYADTDTVTFTGGTGATATLKTSPASGNWPRCTARLSQRRWYAGTDNLPMTFYASRPGQFDDFTWTATGSAIDPIDASLDDSQLEPIKYMVGTALGMFMFTEHRVWQVQGRESGIYAAGEIIAEERTSRGCGDVQPLIIEDNLLYLEENSQGVQEFSPSQLRNFYNRANRSVYAQHYFRPNNQVKSWDYASWPHKTVWAQRENGTMLSLTYLPEHNVYAWSDHATNGYIDNIAVVREGNYDRLYCVVKRERDGTVLRFLERLTVGTVLSEEDLGAVDSARYTSLSAGSGAVTPASASGAGVTVTASSSVFSAGSVGDHIRFGNGLAEIVSYDSGTQVKVDFIFPVTDLAPETNEPKTYTDWTIDTPSTSVKGLWHLEGKVVQIFADGVYQGEKTVSNAAITLDVAASNIMVGLPYEALLQTLPLFHTQSVIQDKKKRTADVSVRVQNTRGLFAASRGSDLFYELTEQEWEDWIISEDADPVLKETHIAASWEEDDSVVIKKTKPMLARVLGFVFNTEIGLD